MGWEDRTKNNLSRHLREQFLAGEWPGGGGGGGLGGTLIFSYIRRLGPCFWVRNFEFQYFWGLSEK